MYMFSFPQARQSRRGLLVTGLLRDSLRLVAHWTRFFDFLFSFELDFKSKFALILTMMAGVPSGDPVTWSDEEYVHTWMTNGCPIRRAAELCDASLMSVLLDDGHSRVSSLHVGTLSLDNVMLVKAGRDPPGTLTKLCCVLIRFDMLERFRQLHRADHRHDFAERVCVGILSSLSRVGQFHPYVSCKGTRAICHIHWDIGLLSVWLARLMKCFTSHDADQHRSPVRVANRDGAQGMLDFSVAFMGT